jgi:hypothetical protein
MGSYGRKIKRQKAKVACGKSKGKYQKAKGKSLFGSKAGFDSKTFAATEGKRKRK